MKTRTPAKRKIHWVARFIIVVVIAVVFVKMVQLHMQINAKQQEIDRLDDAIAVAQVYNEDLTEKNEHYEQYLEQRLRSAGYVYSNDQVYQFSN